MSGLPVYAGCGGSDGWVPLAQFTAALHDLANRGARLCVEIFPGRPYLVSDAEVAVLPVLLVALATGHPVFA